MATDYPIEIDDVGGGVRIAGIANFTDPSNQPQPGGSTIDVSQIDASGITDGFVVTANSDAAEWAAPATPTPAPAPSLQVKLGAAPQYVGSQSLNQFGVVPSNHVGASAVTGAQQIVAAMGAVCVVEIVAPWDIPNLSDDLDTVANLFVTDAAGTNTLTVNGSSSLSTPITGQGTTINWTGTSATIVGADLSWDGATATVTSTAGGVYTCTLTANCSPD